MSIKYLDYLDDMFKRSLDTSSAMQLSKHESKISEIEALRALVKTVEDTIVYANKLDKLIGLLRNDVKGYLNKVHL